MYFRYGEVLDLKEYLPILNIHSFKSALGGIYKYDFYDFIETKRSDLENITQIWKKMWNFNNDKKKTLSFSNFFFSFLIFFPQDQ